MFDHIPDQRETWIRVRCLPIHMNIPYNLQLIIQGHIEKLAAPKLSFHIPDHGS